MIVEKKRSPNFYIIIHNVKDGKRCQSSYVTNEQTTSEEFLKFVDDAIQYYNTQKQKKAIKT